MADKFDEMAGRVQLEMESWAMRQSIDGRRRVIAEALREAHGRGVEEGRASLQRKCEALERGVGQMRLLTMLPLPPEIVTVVKAAKAMVSAADACDREAERHPSSRSSAPVVRSINAMKSLREAIGALREHEESRNRRFGIEQEPSGGEP